MKCSQCGKENSPDSPYCQACGADINPAPPKKSEKPHEKKKRSRQAPWIVIGACFLLFLAIIFFKGLFKSDYKFSTSLPPAVTIDLKDFFKTIHLSVHTMIEGKKYYLAGLSNLRDEKPSAVPTESVPSNAQERFAQIAGDFSLALEHFKLAEKTMKEFKATLREEKLKKCEAAFYTAIAPYIEASRILNENIKGRMTGSEGKMASNFPTDAEAKFEMGEKLMTNFMMNGCEGEYFKYVKTLDSADRGLIYLDFKGFFGDGFGAQKPNVEVFLNFHPPAETLPNETQPAESRPAASGP